MGSLLYKYLSYALECTTSISEIHLFIFLSRESITQDVILGSRY